MNIEQLYRDYNIPFATEGYKHCRPGWVNTPCPFCTGNPGLHLGFDTELNRFVCWRCGGHRPHIVIQALLRINSHEASLIIRQYGFVRKKSRSIKRIVRSKSFKYPANLTELQENHKKYLISRDFNPDKLVNEYQLMGSGVSSLLGSTNYKHRIIIPFMWDGRIVSFDSRAISNRHKNKYMACPGDRELIPHKDILYGRQNKWGETGICVEGPTDVWRLGQNSFATSGIKYTGKQLRLIAKTFKRVFVMFDDENQAIKQAIGLVSDLKFRGVDAYKIDIEGDPGSMSQEDADYLVKQLIK